MRFDDPDRSAQISCSIKKDAAHVNILLYLRYTLYHGFPHQLVSEIPIGLRSTVRIIPVRSESTQFFLKYDVLQDTFWSMDFLLNTFRRSRPVSTDAFLFM